MSRDMTLFNGGDESAFYITASQENQLEKEMNQIIGVK